jgi:DNA-binding transcriptional ArsR family regulator
MPTFTMPGLMISEIGTKEVTTLFIRLADGKRAYDALKAELLKVPEGSPLVVKFPEPNLMDVSFADASLGRLGQEIVEGGLGDRCLVLDGLGPDSLTNLETMIAARRPGLAFIANYYKLVGNVPEYLRKSLDLVVRRGRMTAEGLAKERKLQLNAAGNHLKRLYDLRLIRREGEAKRGGARKGAIHTYYSWQWLDVYLSPPDM